MLNGCLAQIHAHIPVTRKWVAKIGGRIYYALNDMIDAYYQFRVHPSVSEPHAFSSHTGNFEYCEMLPQGEKLAITHTDAQKWDRPLYGEQFSSKGTVPSVQSNPHFTESTSSTALTCLLAIFLLLILRRKYQIEKVRVVTAIANPHLRRGCGL